MVLPRSSRHRPPPSPAARWWPWSGHGGSSGDREWPGAVRWCPWVHGTPLVCLFGPPGPWGAYFVICGHANEILTQNAPPKNSDVWRASPRTGRLLPGVSSGLLYHEPVWQPRRAPSGSPAAGPGREGVPFLLPENFDGQFSKRPVRGLLCPGCDTTGARTCRPTHAPQGERGERGAWRGAWEGEAAPRRPSAGRLAAARSADGGRPAPLAFCRNKYALSPFSVL